MEQTIERVVYRSETNLWYKHDDDPFTVKDVPVPGTPARVIVSFAADTYPEAFELHYGHKPFIPPSVREARTHAE